MKTTVEMIEIMKAHERGEEIQQRFYKNKKWEELTAMWNSTSYDYRIKPKPRECWVRYNNRGESDALQDSVPFDNTGRWVKMREVIE